MNYVNWDKSYKDLAKPSRGRGASAGPIDVNGQYFGKRSLVAYQLNGPQDTSETRGKATKRRIRFANVGRS